MTHTQPALPYAFDAFKTILSQEAMEIHYTKHHKTYYDNVDLILKDPEYQHLASTPLQETIKTLSPGVLFNNVGQAINHDFYWQCLTPLSQQNQCPSELESAICQAFDSLQNFKAQFKKAAMTQFGSGWAWLTKDSTGLLRIETTSNAGTPLQDGKICLLTCDVWEHAYYLDYRNRRADFVDAFWEIVNWEFVYNNLKR